MLSPSHSKPIAGGLLLLLTVLLFPGLPGCGDGAADRGPRIVEVRGEPIFEADFQDLLEYELSYQEIVQDIESSDHRRLTQNQLKTRILSKSLIPLAAVKAAYKDKIPVLLERLEEIKKQIKPGGGNFAELAKQHSQDTNAKTGGAWGVVTRNSLYPPIPFQAFQAKEGEIVGPFPSIVGCHLLWVEGLNQGMLAADDRLHLSHIVLLYEENQPDYMTGRYAEILSNLLKSVKVLKPEYQQYIRIPYVGD